MFYQLAKGTAYFLKGAKLVRRPEIRHYVMVPLTINIVLFGMLVWFGFQQLQPMVTWLMSFVPGFLAFLEWFLWIFLSLFTAIIVFFAFTPIANLLAAPFNALMSEKLEDLLTGSPPESNARLSEIMRNAIGSQFRKLIYIGLWSIGLLLFSLIPVVNAVAPILWILLGSWMMALDYMDYPMGNHDISFKEQKQTLQRHRSLSLGFGGTVLFFSSIPLINFFVIPIAVAGATQLWVDEMATPTGSGLAASEPQETPANALDKPDPKA